MLDAIAFSNFFLTLVALLSGHCVYHLRSWAEVSRYTGDVQESPSLRFKVLWLDFQNCCPYWLYWYDNKLLSLLSEKLFRTEPGPVSNTTNTGTENEPTQCFLPKQTVCMNLNWSETPWKLIKVSMSMKDSDVMADIVDQVIDMNTKKYLSTFLFYPVIFLV